MKAAFLFLYLIRLLPFFACCTRLPTRLAFSPITQSNRAAKSARSTSKMLSRAKRQPAHRPAQTPFQHMAKLMLEYGLYWYAPADKLRSLVRYQDKHHLDEALAAGEKSSSSIRALPHLKWRFTRSIRMCR